MSRFALFPLLCCTFLCAQKKPVTIEVAAQPPKVQDAVGTPVWAPDSKSFAWVTDDKLYVYDIARRSRKHVLTLDKDGDAADDRPFNWENRRVVERNVQWTPDGKRLVLQRNGDLFTWDLAAGKREPLTATAEAERDPKLSPDGRWLSFVRANEMWVRDMTSAAVRRLTSDATDSIWNGRVDWVYPEELDLGTAHWWSPDSRSIAYLQFDVSREWIQPHVNLLNLRAIYEPQRYPKAGTPNADVRLAVIDVASGRLTWMKLGDTRDALLARVAWLPDSKHVAVQRLNRVQNSLQLLFADIATGAARTVLTETDPHWVNVSDDLRFLKGKREFVWSDDTSGFRHLALFSYEGRRLKQLTSGEWEVKGLAGVDEGRGVIYYLSRERSPLGVDLASVPLSGGKRTRISDEAGSRTVSMSPDASIYIEAFQSTREPLRKTLRRADGGAIDTLQPSPEAASDYQYIVPEIVSVKTADGALLYGRLTRPANFDASRRYPAIVSVYGGPHAQSVCDCYAGLSFDQALAQRGYVVWQLDNRGTAGRGKAFETRLYRRFGRQELEDQKAGIAHLTGMGFVDPNRIAIHGWSYGGFLTLYAMLNAPELFRAGIAGAPVVDWRLYDTIYTERYLGLPEENADGYRLSSPITYAGKLSAPLLLVHNFSDDNVLFQGTMQFMAALQKEGKMFDTAIYPQHAHGVTGPARKHMLETMAAFFDRHLKP
jgi:dipeptidyl-peptidase 4